MRARFVLVALLVAAAPVTQGAAQRFPPDSFTNLKVLPRDIPARELVDLMAGFTRALGVRCTFCHVGEEGRPLGTYEFASDDSLSKRKAREMLRLVRSINDSLLPRLEERVEPRLAVNCFTCHRGVRQPRPLQDLVVLAYRAGGLDSALAAYRALRERYYGGAAYDFGEVALSDAGDAVWRLERRGDAVRLHALNVEMNPGSVFAQRQHALRALERAYREEGVAAAAALYRELKARYPAEALGERVVNQVGRALLGAGRVAEAVAAFELNVAEHPGSWSAHDALGEGYAALGDVARAVASYERSLALNSQNANATRKLAELRARGRR